MVEGAGMRKPNPSTTHQRNRLQQFRQAIYQHVFTQARDALFDLLEALLVHPRVTSFAELCLAAVFRRQWPSLYAALRDGQINGEALERLLDPLHGHALRARLGSGGRERVIKHFDAALHLRRMVELLDTGGTSVASASSTPMGPTRQGQLQVEGERL